MGSHAAMFPLEWRSGEQVHCLVNYHCQMVSFFTLARHATAIFTFLIFALFGLFKSIYKYQYQPIRNHIIANWFCTILLEFEIMLKKDGVE